MSDTAHVQTKVNSLGLVGRSRPTIQEIVSKAMGSLDNFCLFFGKENSTIETKNLCDLTCAPDSFCYGFLQLILGRFALAVQKLFMSKGGSLIVCIHEARRTKDRSFCLRLMNTPSYKEYVGISFKMSVPQSKDLYVDEEEYNALFRADKNDSCFSSQVLDELIQNGIAFKSERLALLSSGVVFTLYVPKDSVAILH